MQVRHKATQREVTLGVGDIVEAIGPTKSVTVGRVIGIDRSAAEDKAIVFWFGVGCGFARRSSDLCVLQTKAEYEAIVEMGCGRFLAERPPARRELKVLADEVFNRYEKALIFTIAKDLRVRHIDLMRAVRRACERAVRS